MSAMNKSLFGWEVIGDDVENPVMWGFFCCYKDPVIKQPEFHGSMAACFS